MVGAWKFDTSWLRVLDVLVVHVLPPELPPEYTAVIGWVPVVPKLELSLQVTTLLVRDWLAQEPIVTPLSLKATVPVLPGLVLPDTVAVKITELPTCEGLVALASVVVV